MKKQSEKLLIEKLTPKQEAKMLEVKNFWLDYIFSCKNSINKKQAKIGINFIYGLANLKQPQVIFVDSPMGCQIANMYLKKFIKLMPNILKNKNVSVENSVGNSVMNSVGNSVRDSVMNSVRNSVRNSVEDSVMNSVGNSVMNSVWNSVWNSVRNSVEDSVRNSVENSVRDFESFSYYGNISDYSWVSFYDFFTAIRVINDGKFNQFKNVLLSGIYDMIQLEGFCIVSNLPDKIKRDDLGRLHSETNSAIHFRDGFELFFWHGVNIPEQWIVNKSSITRKTITNEKNAEKRRVLQEILGDNFIKLLGIKLIDSDKEGKFPIKLYCTKQSDKIINENIYYLKVICPSTDREYFICVPKCKNVWEAKAWTFKNQKIEIRHGDIGLLNLSKEFDQPVYQS